MKLADRIANAWNAFFARDTTDTVRPGPGYVSSWQGHTPDRYIMPMRIDKTIVNTIINRIAVDCAKVSVFHAKLNDNDQFQEVMDSGLNYALTESANLDQTGAHFIQDLVTQILSDGQAIVVPVETSDNPNRTGNYDIYNLRVGQATAWYPEYVRVNLYNERKGIREDITLSKRMVAIIENPFYTVMNEPNSTVQRLIGKLALLDVTDRESSSNKWNLLIQLPYVLKSEARKDKADSRIKEIERQLENSKYGVAYSDATEKVIQLNKQIENKLFEEVQYLTTMLYNQLGLTQAVFDGTADEQVMLNYRDRTIEPIMARICAEFRRKFLTKTARTQKQTILFIQNPFSLVPVNQMAEIADKFTRNEILSPNEVRAIVGFKPADDEAADELRNRNISQDAENAKPPAKVNDKGGKRQNGSKV